jgi:hypothetical protein
MDFEDFLEPEVAVTAVVAAAVFSPGARKWLRRGLVYGTAGALIAGDAITSFTQRVGQGARQATNEVTHREASNGQQEPSAQGQQEQGQEG